eukprot:NODE_115_length_18417_cov_0.666012.p13 type:complete len:197 gc:universal NODE_115_length_18417_cov_0.666012:9812-9222(-)
MMAAVAFLAERFEHQLSEHYEKYIEEAPKLKFMEPFVWLLFYLNKNSVVENCFGLRWTSGFKRYILIRSIQTLVHIYKGREFIRPLYKLSNFLDMFCLLSSVAGIGHAIALPHLFVHSKLDFTGYSLGMVVNSHQFITENYYKLVTLLVPLIYWVIEHLKKLKRNKVLTSGCKYCGRTNINMEVDGSCYVCLQIHA